MSDTERAPENEPGDAPAAAAPGMNPPAIPDSSRFRQLIAQGRLAVPVAGCGSPDDIAARPPGTAIRRGEPLVEPGQQGCAIARAPADGRVVGIDWAQVSPKLKLPAVLFDVDEQGLEPMPADPPNADAIADMLRQLRNVTLSAGIDRLAECGVWADRWTTPDLLGQLRQGLRRPIDTILCNALDESPDSLLHHRVAEEFAFEMVAGITALAAIANAAQVWAVMAAYGSPAGWEAMRRAAAGTRLKLVPLNDHYPQSHPTLLIHELTGRHSRPVRLPTETGVLAIDAPAAVAIGRCFLNHQPMLDVPIGLRDRGRARTHWLRVPVGMRWAQVLEQVAIPGLRLELRGGNPLREVHLEHSWIIAGGELTATAAPFERYINPDPCIRCAWCVEGCPVRIQPAGLLEAAQQDDPYLADQFGLDACIECGICSYVCPSHLPILSGIRTLRGRGRGK